MQILHVHSLNFDFRLTADLILNLWSALGYSRKNPNREKEVEDMKIPGVLKKEHVEITIQKEVELSAAIKKKSCEISIGLGFPPWNFQGVPHNFVEYSEAKNF